MTLVQRCEQLPKRSKRVLVLLGLPALMLMVAAALYLPIAYLYDAQTDWRTDASRLLSQSKSAATPEQELNGQLTALQTSPLWTKFYSGSTAGMAATQMQSEVSALLASAQVSTQSLVPIASSPLPHFTRIGTRVSASMRIDQLQSFLAAAANHQHYLRIERAVVLAPQLQDPVGNPPLAVTLEVYGYELADDAKARMQALPQLATGAGP